MNTAATIEITAQNRNPFSATQDTNPLETRWGIQIAQREKWMNAYECGIARVPFGQIFKVKSFETTRENHTTDDTKDKELHTLVSAAECEKLLMDALGGTGAQQSTNWGLQIFGHGDNDDAKMAVISETLLPSLSQIRQISAELGVSVISDVCEGSDDLDYGGRESCVSCWWAWLNSSAIDSHIQNIAMQGMTVKIRDIDTGEIESRHIRPSMSELRNTLEAVRESARLGIKQLKAIWSEIAMEYEQPNSARKDITSYEHGYRKDLHQNQPQDRQFALAREIAKSTNGSHEDVIRLLAESQLQTQQLLNQMAAERQGGMKLAETSEIPTVLDEPAITNVAQGAATLTTEDGISLSTSAKKGSKK